MEKVKSLLFPIVLVIGGIFGVFSARQEYHEDRSYTDLAFHFDASAVPVNDLFTNGKPQAGAGNTGLVFAYAEEFFKQVW